MKVTPPYLSSAAAAQHLKAGAVLLMSTDTLPGFHCRADDAAAVARVMAIKGRSADQSLLVLAGSLAQAQGVVQVMSPAQELACATCWPGPFSLILASGGKLAEAVTGGRTTLAIRVPRRQELRELILQVGVPLVSTSANRSGQSPATEMTSAVQEFAEEVVGCWQGADSAPTRPEASALVDLTAVPFQVLRQGPEPFLFGSP